MRGRSMSQNMSFMTVLRILWEFFLLTLRKLHDPSAYTWDNVSQQIFFYWIAGEPCKNWEKTTENRFDCLGRTTEIEKKKVESAEIKKCIYKIYSYHEKYIAPSSGARPGLQSKCPQPGAPWMCGTKSRYLTVMGVLVKHNCRAPCWRRLLLQNKLSVDFAAQACADLLK